MPAVKAGTLRSTIDTLACLAASPDIAGRPIRLVAIEQARVAGHPHRRRS